MTVITRFPPSPTGLMHIGTARTALYNWLYARRHGGKMLFRIEDTDRKRYTEEHVDAIIKGTEWLGLDWDGDIVSQYENRHRHAAVAQELLEKGLAYKCYCSPEELDAMRAKAKAEGLPTFYDRRWRDSEETPPVDGKPVIRIKAPLEDSITIDDKVQGSITIAAEQLDDFIILRSDGSPTYMLSVVVDDNDMGVTHVIRGDDHINNTFRQSIIYKAMGWDIPTYAHLPLILGPDGAKMSKRHGAASVEEYKDMGYLPEAMRNYLLRLGWSHGDDEIISTEQAIEWFDFDHVGKSPARFDFAKLENLNGHYIEQADDGRLIDLITPILKGTHGLEVNDVAAQRLKEGMEELKSRAKTLIQLSEEASFYVKNIPYNFTEKAQGLLQKDSIGTLTKIQDKVNEANDFDKDTVQEICKNVANDDFEGKLGKVAMPFRAAITGTTVSPSIFDAAAILGKDEVLRRLEYAISYATDANE